MKEAIGYVRISTKDQSNFSIPGQEKYIREYALRHGVEVLEIFTDDGRSAKNFDRPDWRELECFIIKHYRQIDYLIVAKYDRFSRNAAEGLQKIELLEKKYGIIIMSVFEEMYIDYDSPFFFKQRADMLVNAEFELHVIRDRTRFGNHQALSSGRFITAAPWGYRNARDEKNKPIIEMMPERKAVIQLIYARYLYGCSLKEIAAEARQAGFTLKGKSSVKRVLSNCVYAGLIAVPAYRKEAAHHVRGIHQGMIEEHLWWEVQRQLGNVPRPRKIDNPEVPLRGELHCQCGKILTAGNTYNKSGRYYWYYKCNSHIGSNFSAIHLHSQFDEMLHHLSLSELHISYLQESARAQLELLLHDKKVKAVKLKKELKAAQQNLESAEEKYITGSLAAGSYKKWYGKYSGAIASLRYQLSETEMAASDKWQSFAENIHKLGDIKALWQAATLMQKRIFLRLVFNYSLTYSGGVYTTPWLHPLFIHNALILKEKGLLIVEQPSDKLLKKEGSTPPGSLIELSHAFLQFIDNIKIA